MTRFPLRAGTLAAAALSIALAGCISVLPKSDPAQLYSFVKAPDAPTASDAPAASGAPEIGLLFGGLDLPRAASNDGILTRTGTEAAYIAGARWVGPAVVLFREATENAFARSGRLHLISRGEVGKAAAILRIEVREFSARYSDPAAAPTVVVSLEARLNGADGSYLGSRPFAVETKAADNRVSAIVDAYAASTDKVLAEAAAWAETQAAALPQPPSAAPR